MSDVGRTFPVSGRFTQKQKQKLAMVTSVSDAILTAIRPGVTFADLKNVALAAIPEEVMPGPFASGFGLGGITKGVVRREHHLIGARDRRPVGGVRRSPALERAPLLQQPL